MRRPKILAAAALALGLHTAHAQSFRDWTNADLALLGVGSALHIVDWGQTRSIAQHPDQYRELNPLLPSHPSMAQVNAYMLGTLILWPIVADLVPEYRRGILGIWIASRALAVGHNYQIGLRMSW